MEIGKSPALLKKRMFRKNKGRFFLLLFLLCLIVAFWRCLPDPLFNDPLSVVLKSREGRLLGAKISSDEQWRFPLSRQVPEKFSQALILFEDKRFSSHPGIDPFALARAFYLNLKEGRIVSGGSTLTMQVIRLSRKNRNRTYIEKLKEIILALRLELGYSKNEILALFAGNAPFGGNIVGLETASWRYFGRNAKALTWAESALLAVLPNSPGLIHPGRNRKALKDKRDKLLKKLRHNHFLSALDYKLALNEPLPLKPRPLPRHAPHLLETLLVEAGKGKEADKKVFFESTINLNYQKKMTRVLKDHGEKLSRQGIHNGAALIIDNKTFQVLAYAGNRDMTLEGDFGQEVDVIRRPRSTGSILKPFLFASMLEKGEILPHTLVPDIPTQYGSYMPENYDRKYRGAVPAKEALARSLNVPAVRMLQRFGVGRFYDILKDFGMTTLHRPPHEYGLSLILGGAEGKLWDISSMYANLASLASSSGYSWERHQKIRRPILIKGETPQIGKDSNISPAVAWILMEALLQVSRPGMEGYWLNFKSSQKIAWKTGTSYGLRDGWAVGVTPKYTVGVWTGNADGEGVQGLTGIAAAAPILFYIFNFLEKTDWFQTPDSGLRRVEVCKLSGKLATDLCDIESQLIPESSHFDETCNYHRLIHLDRRGSRQVHSKCEPVQSMLHKPWFILPPGMEWYYRRLNAAYKPLPPFREDCLKEAGMIRQRVMDLLYPAPRTRIYIPVDLDEKQSKTIFEAVHRKEKSIIYWHLDGNYIGETKNFHQIALSPQIGSHSITLVDEQGNRLERRFEVLGVERQGKPNILKYSPKNPLVPLNL